MKNRLEKRKRIEKHNYENTTQNIVFSINKVCFWIFLITLNIAVYFNIMRMLTLKIILKMYMHLKVKVDERIIFCDFNISFPLIY